MKTYWGMEVELHAFFTSALDGGEWSASRPGRFTPTERAPGTHLLGGWEGPRAVLDAVMKRKIPRILFWIYPVRILTRVPTNMSYVFVVLLNILRTMNGIYPSVLALFFSACVWRVALSVKKESVLPSLDRLRSMWEVNRAEWIGTKI
jgi:hypothetical protein